MRPTALIVAAALAPAAFLTSIAHAEQTSANGAGTLSTDAHLDVAVVVPKFLSFQVGSAGGTIDQITFTVPAMNVGDSTAIAGTGGNAAGGSGVTVILKSNAGQITITLNNNSGGTGLRNGAGATIPYTEIATSSDNTNLPAPGLTNAGGTAATPALNGANGSASVTNQTATWTFSYTNSSIVDPGTYGTDANGGRVTYTAASP